MKKAIFVLAWLAVFIVIISVSCRAQQINESISRAMDDMAQMERDGIGVTRYNDTLQMAIALYESGTNKERVIQLLDELSKIRRKAYKCMDELSALRSVIESTKDINQTPVWELYYQAEDEFRSERYEKSLELIDKAYNKISELEALETKLALFYQTVSGSVVSFLVAYWIYIVSVVLVSVACYLALRKRITVALLKRRIKDLSNRKESLKKQIEKEQKRYFETKEIGEDTYKIRIAKYGEVLRDINRKLLLLKEELSLLERRSQGSNIK